MRHWLPASTASRRWSGPATPPPDCVTGSASWSTAAPAQSRSDSGMQNLPDLLSPIVGVRPSLLFSGLLVVHIAAGAIGYSAGLLAALSPKRAGRHPRVGGVYYWALAVIFVTATGMSVLRWPEDAYLFVLGSLSFVSASVGYAARKIRWRGWLSFHIGGMSVSVIVLATAFYVDNGPKFASQVPTLVY